MLYDSAAFIFWMFLKTYKMNDPLDIIIICSIIKLQTSDILGGV